MADEFPVTRSGRVAMDSPAGPRRDAASAAAEADPEIARAQIEATRARMSETIDEIEDALLRKKEMIKEKLDVLAPVREQPLKMIGIIFGVGLALGLLTGGSDDDEDEDEARALLAARVRRLEEGEEDDLDEEIDEDEEDDAEAEAWAAAELWEDRAHRLLRVARAQEAELEVHRSRRAATPPPRASRDYDEDEDDDEIESGENIFDRLREGAAERLSGLISEISQRMMRGA